jgi:hypothetical protein
LPAGGAELGVAAGGGALLLGTRRGLYRLPP